MNRARLIPLFPFLLLLAQGCCPESADDPAGGDDEEIAEDGAMLLADNGLAPNGLAPNGLAPNGLAPNGLAPNALAAIQADSPEGALSRQLLQYTVSCALTPDQSFAFSWTDSAGAVHDEVYEGLLGIAPGWAAAPLTSEVQQRLVSACLAARTNFYGVSVLISLRSRLSPLRTRVKDPELKAFPHVEGAFFGNLFTATPHVHACYYDSNVALARSQSRDCAAGHVGADGQITDCGGIEILGSCDDWCHSLDSHERWYHDCDDPDAPNSPATAAAIVVALP